MFNLLLEGEEEIKNVVVRLLKSENGDVRIACNNIVVATLMKDTLTIRPVYMHSYLKDDGIHIDKVEVFNE